jgi:tetratricopeptide (TPR) repeat protein
LISLGVHATAIEDFEGAATFYELAWTESSGASAHTRALVLGNQADLALQQGDYERALPTLAKALELERELENDGGIGWTLCNVALCLSHLGREQEALVAIREAVTRSSNVVEIIDLIREFTVMGAISARRGDMGTAAVLFGFAGGLRDQSAFAYTGAEAELYSRTAAEVERAIGEKAYGAQYARGEEMSLNEAVAYALASLD